MASLFSSFRASTFHNQEIVRKWDMAISRTKKLSFSNVNVKEQSFGCVSYILLQGYLSASLSWQTSVKCIPSEVLGSIPATGNPGESIAEMGPSTATGDSCGLDFNRVNCLVWVLHESARSFSVAVKTLDLTKSGPELAMAWVGVDVNAWHRGIAYQVSVYALLKAAIEVEVFLSRKRSNNVSSVHEILSPITDFLGELIESQLNARNPRLVHWFRTLELPRIAGLFIPLFKKWSVDYAGSGVAGIILATSCCTAVRKLGSGRVSCPLFSASIEDALVELLNLSYRLVSVDKLHYLATEAGFEEDFLFHFGRKVLPSNSVEDVEFWIGLVQRKLTNAFHRENVISDKHTFSNKSLATLGLFAYLGRETRMFLSEMCVNDLDEQTKDFLSYLECGSLLMYTEFSTLSEYQLFMEVVTNEIGWLDFYASKFCDKRRSKQHPIQAEKEIILYTVLTVCYDVIAGFAHYSNSAQQPLDENLLDFLLQSQGLLSVCLEDYWAAYDRTGDIQKFAERSTSDPTASLLTKGGRNSSVILETKEKPIDLINGEKHQRGSRLNQASGSAGLDPVTLVELDCSAAPKPVHVNLLKKTTTKLISASTDIWMGTELLFIDISDAIGLLLKQLKGCQLTKRERKKMKRTLADMASLVPITILMLLPVSAVGHAAMLAAIKRYVPHLIPSPYSSERLDLVKQLKRTKKKEVQARITIEDPSFTAIK